MITPRSCFKTGLLQISGADASTEPNGNLSGNAVKLGNFIEAYERDVLIKCLGYSLYKTFQDSLEIVSPATTHTVKSSAVQKWKDLFSGKEYTLDGNLVKWDGLLFKQGTYDRSLMANYIYFHYMKDEAEGSHSGTGNQKEKSKNSTERDVGPKMVKAWRGFYEMAIGSYDVPSLMYSDSVLCGIDWFGSDNGIRSLYQFINDMNQLDPTTYPNWRPYDFKNMTNFW